jgi:triphosphoribosyl-dephospho-CoA synthase
VTQNDMKNTDTRQQMQAAFLRACEWDVAVRKPGNVSDASPGHGMHAALFRASAAAAAGPLFAPGMTVGQRIEAAVAATWAVAGCNTNLGIVLLCAPLARAVDLHPQATTASALRDAVQDVLMRLTVADAAAAFRAIAHARPAGLGQVSDQDVHHAPSLDLRAAMSLAADRDSVARQYRDAYADLFELAVPWLAAAMAADTTEATEATAATAAAPGLAPAAIQGLYMHLLSVFADSHIVRKHGPAAGHSVMQFAQNWCRQKSAATAAADADDGTTQGGLLAPELVAWDEQLKASGINPGTTADLTVATLLLFDYLQGPFPVQRPGPVHS